MGDSTSEAEWPNEKIKRQKFSPSHTNEQRDVQADQLQIVPHVWSTSTQKSEHDVKFATTMSNIWHASQGLDEKGKLKMPEWWYE